MSNLFPHQQGARAYLTQQLSRQLGLAFKPTDLVFGPVELIPGSNDILVTVQGTDPDRFSGETKIRVKRQDIGALLNGIEIRIAAPLKASVYEILPLINEKYRLSLTEEDVYDEPFSLGYLGPITITMRSESLMYTGRFVVDLISPPSALNTIIVQGTYTDLVYPASLDPTRQVAEIRFGAMPATDIKDRLAPLDVGDVFGADGVEGVVIPQADERPNWYVDLTAPGDYNLAGSVVVYNGANDGVYVTGDHRYAYVCVVELSDQCTKFAGRLVFVYN